MKIITYPFHGSMMEIIEISDELTGRGALRLEEFLYNCLDECRGNCYKAINLKHTKKIDGLEIKVLEHFITRGMYFRLFNVGPEIRSMLKMSGKEDVFEICEEREVDEVVSLLKKEILEKKGNVKVNVKGRRYPRINTFSPKAFKYHSGRNLNVTVKGNVLNLSEEGILAGQIKAFNAKTGKIVNEPEIAGKELYDLKFALDGSSRQIETYGECVWEDKKHETLYAGIRFKYMKQNCKKMIKDFVTQTKT